jgi:transposase-like protein
MTTRKFKADPKKEFCSNPDCPDCGKRGQGNIVKYGHDRKGKQRFKCTTCGHVYVETKNTIFYNRTLPEEKIILVCRLLVERNGVRAIERITGIHRDTVSSIMQALAEHAREVTDFLIQDVGLTRIEVDEMWSFIKKNKRTVTPQMIEQMNMVIAGST